VLQGMEELEAEAVMLAGPLHNLAVVNGRTRACIGGTGNDSLAIQIADSNTFTRTCRHRAQRPHLAAREQDGPHPVVPLAVLEVQQQPGAQDAPELLPHFQGSPELGGQTAQSSADMRGGRAEGLRGGGVIYEASAGLGGRDQDRHTLRTLRVPAMISLFPYA
jgi:hypothetical protein